MPDFLENFICGRPKVFGENQDLKPIRPSKIHEKFYPHQCEAKREVFGFLDLDPPPKSERGWSGPAPCTKPTALGGRGV